MDRREIVKRGTGPDGEKAEVRELLAVWRAPPQFASNDTPNEAHRWKFPWVSQHAWCGKYQAALAVAKPKT